MGKKLKTLYRLIVVQLIKNFLLNLIIGWGLLIPLSIIIPKKRNLMILLSRYRDVFSENIKYFYFYLNSIQEKDLVYYFLAENKILFNELRNIGVPVLMYSNLKSIWILLRAGIIIVDSNEWITNFKAHMLYKTYKVQLWHGSGIKHVMLDNPDLDFKGSIAKKIYFLIKGSLQIYDLMIFTSNQQYERRSYMFPYKKYMINGQPRNDIIFNKKIINKSDFKNIDARSVNAINNFRNNGCKIILYTPTWRNFNEPEREDITNIPLNFKELSRFLEENNTGLIIKLHPMLQNGGISNRFKNIFEYNSKSDIYPVLSDIDILITDYSSIYLDFILLNRPIIFFPYDFDIYVDKMKRIESEDYFKLTPGPKCYNQKELEKNIFAAVHQNTDKFKDEREKLCDYIFQFRDGNSSQRLLEYLKNKVICSSST